MLDGTQSWHRGSHATVSRQPSRNHVWVLLIAPLAVHLTLVRIAGSIRKVFILNPVCQEDEAMGKLVHSFCRRRGQGRNPTGSICPRAWARGGRYLRGASWRPAARGAATALLRSSRLCRLGLLRSSPRFSRFLRCGSQTEAPAARELRAR